MPRVLFTCCLAVRGSVFVNWVWYPENINIIIIIINSAGKKGSRWFVITKLLEMFVYSTQQYSKSINYKTRRLVYL